VDECHKAATPSFKSVLEVREKVLGREHPDTALSVYQRVLVITEKAQ
jgi:hypothetical protein